jgi:hypothetical protein
MKLKHLARAALVFAATSVSFTPQANAETFTCTRQYNAYQLAVAAFNAAPSAAAAAAVAQAEANYGACNGQSSHPFF